MAISFATDIRPLFRPIDIEHMLPFDVRLDDYEYMADPADGHFHARDVQAYLAGTKTPRMPLGGPFWSAAQLALLQQWIDDGFQP